MFEIIRMIWLLAQMTVALAILVVSMVATSLLALGMLLPMIAWVLQLPGRAIHSVKARRLAKLKVVIDNTMDKTADDLCEAA